MAHVLRLCVVHRVSGTLSAAAVELTFSSSAPPGCEAHATVVAPVTTKHPNLNTQLFMIIAFRFVAVCKHSPPLRRAAKRSGRRTVLGQIHSAAVAICRLLEMPYPEKIGVSSSESDERLPKRLPR
jgi:hypothetical protein